MQNVIFVSDSEVSARVQKALFKVGFSWGGDIEVQNLSQPFLFSNSRDYTITYAHDFTYVCDGVKKGLFVPVEADEVISDPMLIEGAEQPENMIMVDGKEYSESTIKKALQEYVK